MTEKTQDEKDREELSQRRLQDLTSNQQLCNQVMLVRLETMQEDLIKTKEALNQIIDILNESHESKEEVKPVQAKTVAKQLVKEVVEDDEDDLGYDPEDEKDEYDGVDVNKLPKK